MSAASLGIAPGDGEEERSRIFDGRYYEVIRTVVDARRARGQPMLLRRGDVLFWHQALVHGAQAIERAGATRNSLIIHYFADGARHYSDVWGRECELPGLR